MHQNAISKTYQNIMVQKCLECVPRKRSGLGSSRIQRCFFGTIRSEMASPGLDEDRVEGLLTHLAAKCEAKCWVMCAMQWCNGDSPTSLYKKHGGSSQDPLYTYTYMLYVYKNMERKNPGIPIFVTSWFSDWDFWSPKRNSQPKVLYRFCWAPKLMLQAVSKNSDG